MSAKEKNPSAVKIIAPGVKKVLRRCAYSLTYGQHVLIIVLTHDSIVSSLAELALFFTVQVNGDLLRQLCYDYRLH